MIRLNIHNILLTLINKDKNGKMTYAHSSNNSFTPSNEFWKMIENLFLKFPFCEHSHEFNSRDEIIKYYEERYIESFDIIDDDNDIYGNKLKVEFYEDQKVKDLNFPRIQREAFQAKFKIRINHLGKVIRFLSNHISNAGTVYKFKHFFESMYYYLKDIHDTNPKIRMIQRRGLDDKTRANYESSKKSFLKIDGGFIKPNEFMDYFNSTCIKHSVPFIMFILYDQCFVVHTTDLFIEKAIQELPVFLSHPNLKHANELFVEAYRKKKSGDDIDCLAKVRNGIEAIRDYIYSKYTSLPPTTHSPHHDLKILFDNHSTTVFDYAKIPESDPSKLKIITDYLRDTVLLTVKLGNFGHHTLANPSLVEENISQSALGLVASIFPYLFYLLK